MQIVYELAIATKVIKGTINKSGLSICELRKRIPKCEYLGRQRKLYKMPDKKEKLKAANLT